MRAFTSSVVTTSDASLHDSRIVRSESAYILLSSCVASTDELNDITDPPTPDVDFLSGALEMSSSAPIAAASHSEIPTAVKVNENSTAPNGGRALLFLTLLIASHKAPPQSSKLPIIVKTSGPTSLK